jgi:hypothetical protein
LTYEDLVSIAKKHLDQVDNIRSFCKQYDLQYTSIIAIRNGSKSEPYPKLLSRLLSIFGYEVEKETVYSIKKEELNGN